MAERAEGVEGAAANARVQPPSGAQDPPRAQAARSGIDRTPYKTDRKISFVSYHTRSISMNITRAEAW